MPQQNNEDELVQQNIGLVKKIVNKFNPPNQDVYDEYFQIGLIGLLKAIRKHDKDRAVLSTLAWSCIFRSLLNYINKEKKHKTTSISTIPCYQCGEDILEYLPDTLTLVEKSIINMKLKGHTFKEIDDHLQSAAGWSSNRYYEIIIKIRKANNVE